jgi:hypothetical protein
MVLGHVGFGAGAPKRRFNNTLRGLKSVPLRFAPA